MPRSSRAISIAILRPVVLALLLIFCAPSFSISVDDVTEKGAVQVLSSASWDAFLADLSKPLVVLHYAPWCGHCKRLLPDFEVASRRCASAVVFSKVDCTAQSGLCTGVNGYPHIKIHIKDDAAWSVREYDGETTVEALEALCQRLASPQLTTISDPADLEKQSAAFAIDSRADAPEMTQFHAAAKEFYHVTLSGAGSGMKARNTRRRFSRFTSPTASTTVPREHLAANSATPAAYTL